MADVTPEGPEGAASLRRACDQCRIRKIRCDKENGVPCSNCKASKRECISTGLGQKPREARQRVMVSNQYDRKIDYLGTRLSDIEKKLDKIMAYINRDDASTPASSFFNATGATNTISKLSIVDKPSDLSSSTEEQDEPFAGNSSMVAHTMSAGNFLEQAATESPFSQEQKTDIQTALASLRQLTQMQSRKGTHPESTFTHRKPIPAGDLSQLPQPPAEVVLRLLLEVQVNPPMTFTTSCSYITVPDFNAACQKVFVAKGYNTASFVIASAGLYYLIQEKLILDEPRNAYYRPYYDQCRDNLETALHHWPLIQSASKETIQALLLGVTYSVETSKFTLALQFNSTAAAMCQTLGWHRRETTGDEPFESRASIFWFCYMMDKGLSLRFGRNSIMQDWDISVPPDFGNSQLSPSWNKLLNGWIKTGSVLGDMYEKLYSPQALLRSPEHQIETARILARELKLQWSVLDDISTAVKRESTAYATVQDGQTQEQRAMSLDMILKSAQVTHFAFLTLIYRAIPSRPGFPSTFNAECIDAARTAFRYHEECIELTKNNIFEMLGYLHWTILYVPFTPFTVLFCHVIETSNVEDLKLLGQFVMSLQAAMSISQGIHKFHRLCATLHQIAALYVDARTQSVGADFDMYLSQLGLFPQQGSTEVVSTGEILDDWFSGNRYIMGVMEEDMFDFNFGE